MDKKPRRNGPCPCGSGKKTKKCCLPEIRKFQDRIAKGESPQSLVVERILGTPAPEEE